MDSKYSPGKISQFLKLSGEPDEQKDISKLFSTPKTIKKPTNKTTTPKVEEDVSSKKSPLKPKSPKFVTNAERRIYLKQFKHLESNEKEKNQRTIFVGNVSLAVTKKELLKLFGKCGKIQSIRLRSAPISSLTLPKKALVIKKEFHEKRSTLNAYIVFDAEASVEEALKLNNAELKGLHIRVDRAGSSKKHLHKNSVFVGNLPYDIEEETLRSTFSDCGAIENIRIIRDSKTLVGKGFGYIIFEDPSSVETALSLDGKKVMNRDIRVQLSTNNIPKKKKPVKVSKKPKKEGESTQNKSSGKKQKKKHRKDKAKKVIADKLMGTKTKERQTQKKPTKLKKAPSKK